MAKKQKRSMINMEKRAVDKMMGSVAFIAPLSSAPQLVTIFGKQEASGISAASWAMYLLVALITLAYGAFHKLRPIIISQSLWIVIDVLIIIGVLMYGGSKSIAVNYDTLLLLNNIGKALIIISFAFGGLTLYQWSKLRTLKIGRAHV